MAAPTAAAEARSARSTSARARAASNTRTAAAAAADAAAADAAAADQLQQHESIKATRRTAGRTGQQGPATGSSAENQAAVSTSIISECELLK